MTYHSIDTDPPPELLHYNQDETWGLVERVRCGGAGVIAWREGDAGAVADCPGCDDCAEPEPYNRCEDCDRIIPKQVRRRSGTHDITRCAPCHRRLKDEADQRHLEVGLEALKRDRVPVDAKCCLYFRSNRLMWVFYSDRGRQIRMGSIRPPTHEDRPRRGNPSRTKPDPELRV